MKQLLHFNFMPHGHCFLWDPLILWMHVTADVIIAVAYFSIPFALIFFIKKRDDVFFSGLVLLFALFIVTCGVGHALDIYNLWHGAYHASAIVRLITAFASATTAVALWLYMPVFLTVPSTRTLQIEIQTRIEAEEALRQLSKELEQKVKERTNELEEFNSMALNREERMIALKAEVNSLLGALDKPAKYKLDFADDSSKKTSGLTDRD